MNQVSESQNQKKSKAAYNTRLVEDWVTFANIMLSPPIVIFSVVTIGLIYVLLSSPAPTNIPPLVEATITLMISVFSGLVGALIARRWSEITEGSILITRGKSAIRGLKLLLNNIAAVEQRAKIHLGNLNEKAEEYKVLRMSYEEFIDRCNLLQEEAINAIEEWQDIIPEAANLKTRIGLLSQLKGEQIQLTQEIAETKAQLASVQEQSDEERETLRKLVREKEQELKQVNRELRKQQNRLSTSVLSGSKVTISPTPGNIGTTTITTGGVADQSYRTCPSCQHQFWATKGTIAPCPNCGNWTQDDLLLINP